MCQKAPIKNLSLNNVRIPNVKLRTIIRMNQANLIIFVVTSMASMSLCWNSLQRRFLPIARPLALIAFCWVVFSLLRSTDLLDLGLDQWWSQLFLDLSYFIVSFFFPLWAWMMIEYHEEKQVSLLDVRILILLIHPIVVYTLYGMDLYEYGFLSQESDTALRLREDRIGAYAGFQKLYAWGIVTFLFILTPVLMIWKRRDSLWKILQIGFITLLPFVVFAMFQTDGIKPYHAGPSFVLYLYWVSRQYRLLDIMPLALQGIVDDVGSGVLVSNLNSKLLYANDCARKFLDFDQQNMLVPTILKNRFDLRATSKQTAQLETGNRYIDATMQPIFDPETGRHLGATLSLHDVTLRKQAELELRDFLQQKSDFFAGISHEFRTPLTLSLGNLNDVMSELDKENQAYLLEPLARAKSNNLRLLNLVNQLLELSQIDAGSLKIHPALLRLDEYLPSVLASFESLASKQNVRINFDPGATTGNDAAVYFDPDAFDKIVSNLISNALKSMPEGGDISVRLALENPAILEMSIRDSGCGISERALANIFDMFYSQRNDNTQWPVGTGVGLSLVKQLLNQHGGDIRVQSVEGEGSVFTLSIQRGDQHFPDEVIVCQEELESSLENKSRFVTEAGAFEWQSSGPEVRTTASASASSVDESSANQSLVLIAEDNPEMRAYIRKHLGANFRLLEADDGEEALELALHAIPDLVLSDVMMPRMDGYELCQRLKSDSRTSHVPVILLTAKSGHASKIEGLSQGADDYISKPFDMQELYLKISNLISSADRIRQRYQVSGLVDTIEHADLGQQETSFLSALKDYVHDNIGNPEIKVSDLAASAHMSERTLSRKLKALTGESPKKMLLTIRLEYTANLLRTTHLPITQIGSRAGFSDGSHFTRSFKEQYSMTPSDFRKTGQ